MLDPSGPGGGGYGGQAGPHLLVRKIVASLTDTNKKNPTALARKMRPIFAGPTSLAVLGTKISTRAMHTVTEKPLTVSAATSPNFRSTTNVQPFSAPIEAQPCKRETV